MKEKLKNIFKVLLIKQNIIYFLSNIVTAKTFFKNVS